MRSPMARRRNWPEWAWDAGILGLVALVWQHEERWDGAGLVFLLVILAALRVGVRNAENAP